MNRLLSGAVACALACGSVTVAFGATSAMGSMPKCKANDPVVWVASNHKTYYAKGSAQYGKSSRGSYACRSKAAAMGAKMSNSAMMKMGTGRPVTSGSSMGSGSMGSGSMGSGSMGSGSMGSGSMGSGAGATTAPSPMATGVLQPGSNTATSKPVTPGSGEMGGGAPANGNVPNNPKATPQATTTPH